MPRADFEDFELPLAREDETAHELAKLIVEIITEHKGDEPWGGGGNIFYSPAEWEARGEDYGNDADLVIVHDGGDAAPYFNPSYEDVSAYRAMRDGLNVYDAWAELQTSWYTAIYLDA